MILIFNMRLAGIILTTTSARIYTHTRSHVADHHLVSLSFSHTKNRFHTHTHKLLNFALALDHRRRRHLLHI